MEDFEYYRLQAEIREKTDTSAVLLKFCREMDSLVKKTIDERNPNQVVSRVLIDVKAFTKSSILSHTGGYPPPTRVAGVPGQRLQPIKPTQMQTAPKAVCPPPATPRKTSVAQTADSPTPPKKAPQILPSPKDTNVQPATTKSYAGIIGTPAPRGLPDRPVQMPVNKKPTRTSRVFVRLPEDSPLRAAHPLYIVKTVNSILPLGKGVETATPVRTGIALSPKAGTTPEDLLLSKDKISTSLGNGIVERDENWVVVKIHDLPTQMIALNEDNTLTCREISIEGDIFPEAAKAFGATPETGCWARKQEGSLTASIRFTFREESMRNSPKSVVIMGTRLKVEYPMARGVRPPQCRKCWGLHRLDTCKAEPRCRMCGDSNHKTIEHPSDIPPNCVNCKGPHTADSPSCPKTAPAAKKLHQTKKASNAC
jgi:hypothetical protein